MEEAGGRMFARFERRRSMKGVEWASSVAIQLQLYVYKYRVNDVKLC